MQHESELQELIKNYKDIELALNESSIISITNSKGVIQYANDKFCKVSKYRKEELIGSNQSIVNSGHHSREFFKEMWRTIGTGNVWKGELRNRAKDGSYYWVDTTIVPFMNEKGKPYKYISIRHDITKRIEYEEIIEKMAFYDHLTQLPNRNSLSKWINDYHPKIGDTVVALFMDIDRFQVINDNYGHLAGDTMLKEIAKGLKKCVTEDDILIRQGGDEFLIILNDEKDVLNVIQKIKELFQRPFYINGEQLQITTSLGISMNTIKEDDEVNNFLDFVELTIRQAERAMYYVEQRGGNSYNFSTVEQNEALERYYQLDEQTKYALKRNEFYLVYQPLIDLKTNQISGVEALLRWENEKLGSVSPAEFIPILEESGRIVSVGEWVLKTICKQIKKWHHEGIHISRVGINVSPVQFKASDFIKSVKNILAETGVDGKYIDIEITEGTILNIDEPKDTFKRLKDLGVSISIDDFGTGYSSLSYLKHLPVDTLKIDRSFIADLNINGEVIVDTIISMGKNLKHNVIAEGIEKEEQAIYLKKQECHEGQGYYWSKPVDPEQITELFQRGLFKKSNEPF